MYSDSCSHFVQAYEQGHTPNPDVLCNRHIKFSALHRYCRQHLDADVIATGHYAIVERDEAGSKFPYPLFPLALPPSPSFSPSLYPCVCVCVVCCRSEAESGDRQQQRPDLLPFTSAPGRYTHTPK